MLALAKGDDLDEVSHCVSTLFARTNRDKYYFDDSLDITKYHRTTRKNALKCFQGISDPPFFFF